MSVGRQIFFNTVLQSLGKAASVTIGLLGIGLMTRYLGDRGFGEYTTVISFMGFFGILADLGLYLIATREISRDEANAPKILGGIFALRFFTVTLALLIGAVLALFFPYSKEVKQAMFLGIIAFTFVSGTQVLVGVFQKFLVFYKLTASEILQRALMLLGIWGVIRLEVSMIWFVAVLCTVNAVHFLVSLYIARKLIPFKLEIDVKFWKEILKKSWPLGFSVVLNLIYFRADTLILSAFKPAADVGIYGLPYKILEILISFPAMFAGLLMPLLSQFAFRQWPNYKLYLQKSFDALLLAIVPIVSVGLIYARPIIDLVGGKGFVNADRVLQILVIAVAVMYLGNLLGYAVVALDAQKKMVKGYLMGSVLGLLLYFSLIPKYSYFGAAWGTVAVELAVFVFAYFLTSKISNFFPSFLILWKASLAALPMIITFQALKIFWLWEAILGLAIYLACLLLLKAVPWEFLRELGVFRRTAHG